MEVSESKADRFHSIQLRSVLDQPGTSPDPTWLRLLSCGSVSHSVDLGVEVALPDGGAAEAQLLSCVEALAATLASDEALGEFYRHFGWPGHEDYFRALGETQAVVCDLDYNDSDDRLAICLLAFQMASANSGRRRDGDPGAACTLYLDARSYDREGLVLWRTLRLATRLESQLSKYGLVVVPVLGDLGAALLGISAYLGEEASVEALDARLPGARAKFGASRADLWEAWHPGATCTLWILSSICPAQVADVARLRATRGVRLTVFEQAAPAWQSVDVAADAELQPDWTFPPPDAHPDHVGFGAEPSNVRSGQVSYPEVLDTYFRFQIALSGPAASPPARYVLPALAREPGVLPAPPGERMLRVSGRTLSVLPGEAYVVMSASDTERAEAAFSALVSAAESHAADTLGPEMREACLDDSGDLRESMAHIQSHGTSMADAILVAVAARPDVETCRLTRRLAAATVLEAMPRAKQ